VIYIVDTHAWIEYFIGSADANPFRNLLGGVNKKFITMECCLAELKGYCLRNGFSFEDMKNAIKKNSVLLPVLLNHWLDAAQIRYEMRKVRKGFGLIDSVLVAKQNELQCSIISGDPHFKGMKNVVYLGKK